MAIETVGFAFAKIASAAGGLFGALAMFAFMRPKTVFDATIRGGVCTGSAIIGSPIMLEYSSMPTSTDHLVFAGALIGFLSWGVLSMTARFFIKAEATNQDVVEAIKEIRK
jgi:hypothetical protein